VIIKTGYENPQKLKNKWGDKYPVSLKSWEENWHVLSSFFQFSEPIRKIMYTKILLNHLTDNTGNTLKQNPYFQLNNL
jgi:transposase-like protein